MDSRIKLKTIALALITYYPSWYQGKLRSIRHTDKVRGDLAIEFCNKAIKLGCQIVVADGKSSKTFRKTLSSINGLIFIKRRSLERSSAKLQAIKKAAKMPGVKVIILAEPEKVSLLDSLKKITTPILEEKADVVVPKRQDDLFKKTYPLYMYHSEIEGNKLYNEVLRSKEILRSREDLDMFFGPRVFANNKKVISLFNKPYHFKIGKSDIINSYFNPGAYSTTLYFPIIKALLKGLRLENIEIPFSYPQLQKENEEKGSRELFEEKRKNQRISILIELLHFLRFIEKK